MEGNDLAAPAPLLPNELASRSTPMDPQTLFQGLVSRGLSPIQAAVAVGNWQRESNLRTSAFNPREGAFGLDQWRLERRTALEALARARGVSPLDPNLQMDYFMQELKSRAGGKDFLAASDLAGANNAMKTFIAYGDDSQGTRLKNAQAIFAKYGGSTPNPNFEGEMGGNVNDLFPQGDQPVAVSSSEGQSKGTDTSSQQPSASGGAGSASGEADGKKQLMKLMLLSSLANVRLQPVDYNPYAVMPHFQG